MRRIAFVSDVHSNLQALEAVLGEIGKTELYCLGDIVGYGADPNGVIEMLRALDAVAVKGNHDEAVLSGDTSWFNTRAAVAARWTASKLTPESKDYLSRLPLQIKTEFDGTQVFLTHGSPDDNLREYVELETHSQLFGHYLGTLGVKVVGLGHTHRPFVWKEREGTVFNPGSVGQPRDSDPRASYAIVVFDRGEAEVKLRRVEYDIEGAASRILAAGLPEQFAARLFEGW
jgi:putative phosphoesterase